MKLNKLSAASIAATVAIGSFSMLPGIAQAETSASLTLSNMYLWRGVNLTPDGPALAASLDYSHESGVYAGVWTTNEDDGTETDLYFGYAGEAGDFSYDISYILYLYPEEGFTTDDPTVTPTNADLGDTDLSEIALGVGYKDFNAKFFISSDSDIVGSDYIYYTLDYTVGKYNILYGAWSFDEAGNNEYSHVTLSYAYNDELTFAVNVAQEDIVDGVETDPLFVVSYSVPLK